MKALDNYTFSNSNTRGDEAKVVGNMAVHHSRMYPSHVVLLMLGKPRV